ncbi:MAG TPA: M3 family oligoendopeptidase [Alphaproteobacteria bacterium]
MLKIEPLQRRFLPTDFKVTDWKALEPYFQILLGRDISTRDDFDQFQRDINEISCILGEESTWRFIRTTTHTNDQAAQDAYSNMNNNITPAASEMSNKLTKKLLASPFSDQPRDEAERLMFRGMKAADKMFRSENIPLMTELRQLSVDSDKLRGSMTVELDGETLTIPQLSGRFYSPDRAVREKAWHAMHGRRLQDKEKYDTIFDQMVKKRHQIALNAGYKNFRDYQFDAMQRFDYTPEDCMTFHAAIRKHFTPLVTDLYRKRSQQMQLDRLMPWDMMVDPLGRPALKVFASSDDLLEKGLVMLDGVDPFFGDVVRLQRDMGRLDLASRPHKRPGAYNSGLPETNVPFMFANTTDKVNDVRMFVHEAGHAGHSLLAVDLPLQAYKRVPIEMAELASMSMELLVFDKWSIFLSDTEECERAQEDFLEEVMLKFLPVAQGDLFQHEIYTHLDMTSEDRNDLWYDQLKGFTPAGIDLGSYPEIHRTRWHNVSHFFGTPFYYIEYLISQMGALQIWRNYLHDPQKTIKQYKEALALGYTKSLPELYRIAGIKFDFSEAMIADLVPFLTERLACYKNKE